MKNKMTIFTKRLLDVMFYIGVFVTITISIPIHIYSKYNITYKQYYTLMCILYVGSGIYALLIIQELRKIFSTVLKDDCFIRENVDSLRKMGTHSFFIAALTGVRSILEPTPAVLITLMVFIIAGLFSKVLSQVFDKAVTYKLENDLTI